MNKILQPAIFTAGRSSTEAAYLNGRKVEVHYFLHKQTGAYFDSKIKQIGWSSQFSKEKTKSQVMIDNLIEIIELENISDDDRRKINLLIQAISDWPSSVLSLKDFSNKIIKCLNIDSLTYPKLVEGLKGLSPQFAAWEKESITCLVEFMKSATHVTLEQEVEFIVNKNKR